MINRFAAEFRAPSSFIRTSATRKTPTDFFFFWAKTTYRARARDTFYSLFQGNRRSDDYSIRYARVAKRVTSSTPWMARGRGDAYAVVMFTSAGIVYVRVAYENSPYAYRTAAECTNTRYARNGHRRTGRARIRTRTSEHRRF